MALVAVIVNVYEVPFTRFCISQVSDPLVVHVPALFDAVTVYDVILSPPSLAGGSHVITAEESPAVAVTF